MKSHLYFSAILFSLILAPLAQGMNAVDRLEFSQLLSEIGSQDRKILTRSAFNYVVSNQVEKRKNQADWPKGGWVLRNSTKEDLLTQWKDIFTSRTSEWSSEKQAFFSKASHYLLKIFDEQERQEIAEIFGLREEYLQDCLTSPMYIHQTKPSFSDGVFTRFLFGKDFPESQQIALAEGLTVLTVDFSGSPDQGRDRFLSPRVVTTVEEKIPLMLANLVTGGDQIQTLALKNIPHHGPLQVVTFKALRDRFPKIDGLGLTGNNISHAWVGSALFQGHSVEIKKEDGGSNTYTVPLRRLDLNRTLTGTTSHFLNKIVELLREKLVVLNLSNNGLGDLDISSLCSTGELFGVLASLDLSNNKIEWQASECFWQTFPNLQALNLDKNQVKDSSGYVLAQAIQQSSVQYISISGNPLSEETRKAITGDRRPFADYGTEEAGGATSPATTPKSPTSPLDKMKGLLRGAFTGK